MGTQRFTWFGFWPTSMGGVQEKVSLTKGRDYEGGTKTLSQNPNPKYTQKSSQSPEARDQRKPKFLSQNKARLRTLTCGCLLSLINQLPHYKHIYTKYKLARVYIAETWAFCRGVQYKLHLEVELLKSAKHSPISTRDWSIPLIKLKAT